MFAILLEMHLLDACAKAFDVCPNTDILLWKQNHSAGNGLPQSEQSSLLWKSEREISTLKSLAIWSSTSPDYILS